LAEASSLVWLVSENPNFDPSNLTNGFLDWCFWFSGTSGFLVLLVSGTSGFLVLLVLVKTRVSLSGSSIH
jgi:hypothetical protein